jgi:hypothetical protein
MRWLCALAIALAAAPAAAQPAAALGHPLPAQELATGTVSVRVIAGSPTKNVIGVDVTLDVNGTPRQARTDAGGRAIFKDLPAGATVQAKIVDEDKKEVASDAFPLPADSGVKVMLTTRPMQAGMGGAPFAGGAGGGMPEPRVLSGQPRPEQADPAGTYTVRVTYDDLKEATPPANVPVVLVGYGSDDSVKVQVKKTGDDGRVQFTDLDRSGGTSYFAMAELTRGSSTDRLFAQPIVMLPQVGIRVLLSSAKRDSAAPPIDDLDANGEAVPAGKVRVTLEGVPENEPIALVDAATGTVIAKTAIGEGPPDPTAISGGAPFEARPDLPAGTLAVDAHGGPGSAMNPLPHIAVRVFPADQAEPGEDAIAAETDAEGNAKISVMGAQLKAVLTINGRDFMVPAFDLSQAGGALHVTAQWTSKPEAAFDYVPRADQVVYAETLMRGQRYRTRPFVGVPERGAHVVMQILPRLLFSFSLTSRSEDQFLNVQGRFELYNNSWAPYSGGPDGVLLPLPKGFKAGILAEQDQADIAVVPNEGFRIVRPVPPGGKRFLGGFSLPVEDGTAEWKLDLPFGAYQSGIEIMQVPGMSIKTPPNVTASTETDARGKWYVLPRITILPNQSMVMAVSGMPSTPGWSIWVPRLVALLVVALMLGGLGLAIARRRTVVAAPDGADRAKRRQQLLDELVELERGERTPKEDRRREVLLGELERLWDEG